MSAVLLLEARVQAVVGGRDAARARPSEPVCLAAGASQGNVGGVTCTPLQQACMAFSSVSSALLSPLLPPSRAPQTPRCRCCRCRLPLVLSPLARQDQRSGPPTWLPRPPLSPTAPLSRPWHPPQDVDHASVLPALLEGGAKPLLRVGGMAALHYAAHAVCLPALRVLLQHAGLRAVDDGASPDGDLEVRPLSRRVPSLQLPSLQSPGQQLPGPPDAPCRRCSCAPVLVHGCATAFHS